jgi:hypothetical protein
MFVIIIAFTIIAISSDARVVIDNGQPLNIRGGNANDVTLDNHDDDMNGNTHTDDGLCRRCMCKVNGCPEAIYSRCISAGSLCCCCLPGNHPCLELQEFEEVHETAGTLEALEEGIEDIGQLEKK